MPKQLSARNVKTLWGLIIVTLIVWIVFRFNPLITGSLEVDGLLAVSLGFYICSRAAANFLNAILYEFDMRRWQSLARADLAWLGLNALVLLCGLWIVVTGVYRFYSRAF